MKTLEQRIDAGMELLTNFDFIELGAREKVEMILRASYPELHSDKPSHWLAPNEATPEMWAGFRSVNCTHGKDGMEEFTYFSGDYGNWVACYMAMRTAYQE